MSAFEPGPKSHSTTSKSRPVLAAQNVFPTTATPLAVCTTWVTPGTPLTLSALKLFTFAPKIGGCFTTAVCRFGTIFAVTSKPNFALPSTLAGASMRRVGLPIMRKSFASFSVTLSGTASALAASASAPNDSFCPAGPITTPFSVRQSVALTFHLLAAVETSIARAVAPTVRICVHEFTTDEEPPVIWIPNMVCVNCGAAGANSARTFDQSQSSSSATSIGNEVMTPWPNSRCFTCTVTDPSRAMRRNAFGVVLGFGGVCAAAILLPPGR